MMVLRQRYATWLGTSSPKRSYTGRDGYQSALAQSCPKRGKRPKPRHPQHRHTCCTSKKLLHHLPRRRVRDLVGAGCAVRTTCPKASCVNSWSSILSSREVCLDSSRLKARNTSIAVVMECLGTQHTSTPYPRTHNLESHTRDHPQVYP